MSMNLLPLPPQLPVPDSPDLDDLIFQDEDWWVSGR